MPIQNQTITTLSLRQIQSSIDNISRNAFKLTNPGGSEGKLYIDTVPTELDEGSVVFYFDGTNYRMYTKINGVIKYWALT